MRVMCLMFTAEGVSCVCLISVYILIFSRTVYIEFNLYQLGMKKLFLHVSTEWTKRSQWLKTLCFVFFFLKGSLFM